MRPESLLEPPRTSLEPPETSREPPQVSWEHPEASWDSPGTALQLLGASWKPPGAQEHQRHALKPLFFAWKNNDFVSYMKMMSVAAIQKYAPR